MEMLVCWNVFQVYANDLNYLVTDHWKYLIWVETKSAKKTVSLCNASCKRTLKILYNTENVAVL